ncbi:MAG: Hsp33 family molecular chaperone HslO [Gammaproteobacteria bacterium]|jgi:molecular chaperone Hsp33
MNDAVEETLGVDAVHRFTVEHQSVRGRFVRLGPAWLALREHADYPAPVRRLLGEAAAAAALLASTIKFEGELTLQMQGSGAVRLLVAQCTHDLKLRAVARFDAQRVVEGFEALVGDGQLAVTLEAEGGARYQGIVPLGGGSLAAALERYFEGSEQLPTAVVLAADDAQAAGMLVQRLPQSGGLSDDRAGARGGSVDAPSALAAREAEATATLEATRDAMAAFAADELLGRPVEELLQQACAGHDLRLQPAQSVEFRCRCSAERVSGMLRALGEAELDGIIAEQGAVTVTCEFCHRPWRFEAREVAGLFGGADRPVDGSGALN